MFVADVHVLEEKIKQARIEGKGRSMFVLIVY